MEIFVGHFILTLGKQILWIVFVQLYIFIKLRQFNGEWDDIVGQSFIVLVDLNNMLARGKHSLPAFNGLSKCAYIESSR